MPNETWFPESPFSPVNTDFCCWSCFRAFFVLLQLVSLSWCDTEHARLQSHVFLARFNLRAPSFPGVVHQVAAPLQRSNAPSAAGCLVVVAKAAAAGDTELEIQYSCLWMLQPWQLCLKSHAPSLPAAPLLVVAAGARCAVLCAVRVRARVLVVLESNVRVIRV